MQALVYRRSPALYVADRLLDRWWPRRFFPRLVPLRLQEWEPPTREGWVTLRTRLCGICGSDLALLHGRESPLLEPYASFPAVLGHEIVAVVERAPEGGSWRPGDRVVVDPLLSCAVRGLPPCTACARGDEALCECFTEGALPPGVAAGYTAGAGGGFAERSQAHPLQLRRIPDGMDDRTAVLADSLASALQPVCDHFPADDEVAVVFGAGVIGQHAVRSLRALGSKARLVVVARHGFQAEAAREGGADEVLLRPSRAGLAAALGTRVLPTTLGGGMPVGGADVVFECSGGSSALQEGLLALRGRGRFVMVGTTGPVRADLSPIWFRGQTVSGSPCASRVRRDGRTVRTHDLALELLAREPQRWRGLVTHVVPWHDHARAFRIAFDKRGHDAIKVAIALPGADIPCT